MVLVLAVIVVVEAVVFERAAGKVEDARTILEQLTAARDAIQFRAHFNAFLSAARAVEDALEREGRHDPVFRPWFNKKQEEIRQDDLLKFVHRARKEDFHEGKHRLVFRTHVTEVSTGDPAVVAQRPAGARLAIGSDGMHWIADEGKPTERRIPLRHPGIVIQVGLNNPPQTHRGRPLPATDPITICALALAYCQGLVHEARQTCRRADVQTCGR